MPLTTMRLDAETPRPGWGFAARSALGPVGFTDPMLVTAWEPPGERDGGRFRVVKTGRVLGGRVDVRVAPRPTGSRIEWRQDLVVRFLPPVLRPTVNPLVRVLGERLYGRALDAIVAEADRAHVVGKAQA
jgi:hypothetical protein